MTYCSDSCRCLFRCASRSADCLECEGLEELERIRAAACPRKTSPKMGLGRSRCFFDSLHPRSSRLLSLRSGLRSPQDTAQHDAAQHGALRCILVSFAPKLSRVCRGAHGPRRVSCRRSELRDGYGPSQPSHACCCHSADVPVVTRKSSSGDAGAAAD